MAQVPTKGPITPIQGTRKIFVYGHGSAETCVKGLAKTHELAEVPCFGAACMIESPHKIYIYNICMYLSIDIDMDTDIDTDIDIKDLHRRNHGFRQFSTYYSTCEGVFV